jgi:hypothetical protein
LEAGLSAEMAIGREEIGCKAIQELRDLGIVELKTGQALRIMGYNIGFNRIFNPQSTIRNPKLTNSEL